MIRSNLRHTAKLAHLLTVLIVSPGYAQQPQIAPSTPPTRSDIGTAIWLGGSPELAISSSASLSLGIEQVVGARRDEGIFVGARLRWFAKDPSDALGFFAHVGYVSLSYGNKSVRGGGSLGALVGFSEIPKIDRGPILFGGFAVGPILQLDNLVLRVPLDVTFGILDKRAVGILTLGAEIGVRF